MAAALALSPCALVAQRPQMAGAKSSAFCSGVRLVAAPRPTGAIAARRQAAAAPVTVARGAKGAAAQQITVDVEKPLGLVRGGVWSVQAAPACRLLAACLRSHAGGTHAAAGAPLAAPALHALRLAVPAPTHPSRAPQTPTLPGRRCWTRAKARAEASR